MIQDSGVPLQKSRLNNCAFCLLTATTPEGHCKTENGGGNNQRSTIKDLLPSRL